MSGNSPIADAKRSFVFRLDVSPDIGFGHFRRCVVLANTLQSRGARVIFLLRSENIDRQVLSANGIAMRYLDWDISAESDVGELVRVVNENNAIAIVDHYRVTEQYQKQLSHHSIRWLQFDWAAQQPLWADWVVSPSPAARREIYQKLARNPQTQFLLGPQYVILSSQFNNSGLLRKRDGYIRRVIILMGGGGDRGAIALVLGAIGNLPAALRKKIYWEVISGGMNPNLIRIRKWFAENHEMVTGRLTVDANDVASRIAEADLAITSGGTVAYETTVLGCPSLIISIADNQEANATALEKLNVAKYLGAVENLKCKRLTEELLELLKSPAIVQSMSDAASSTIDSRGAERIAEELLSQTV